MRQINRFIILASAAALASCATSPGPATASGGAPAPAGYYKKTVEGQEMFCRNDLVTGSRTEREGEKCYTADELKAYQEANQAAINGSLSTQHGAESTK
jgi:hypothetical protein